MLGTCTGVLQQGRGSQGQTKLERNLGPHSGIRVLETQTEGFIRHRPLPTPPSNPPSPPLLRGRFGIDLTSIRHRFDIDFLIWPYFAVESMLNRCQTDPRGGEGEVDSREGSGGAVPNKPLTILETQTWWTFRPRKKFNRSGTKKRGFLKGVFAKMYASLGCGALSAKCTAGPNILGYFLFPWPWHWTLQKPPLLKPPCLGSWLDPLPNSPIPHRHPPGPPAPPVLEAPPQAEKKKKIYIYIYIRNAHQAAACFTWSSAWILIVDFHPQIIFALFPSLAKLTRSQNPSTRQKSATKSVAKSVPLGRKIHRKIRHNHQKNPP